MGNQLFPADNPWNQQITNAPVAANSATLVASIGLNSPLHPDFGTVYAGALNGIPYNVVPGSQPKITVVIDAYASESDLLPIPIPAGALIEGDPLPPNQNNGDRHMLVYDKDNNVLYETFNTHRPAEESDHQWHADSEAVWYLNQDYFRTAGFTSADAAGLPILPGLVRDDEVLDQGKITHALRFTVPATDNAYVFPASHYAGSNNPALPRMGERFRLKASVDISHYSATDRVILQAIKDYGMIVADNGSSWYLSGAPSSRWDDSDLHYLSQLKGSDFEAVDLTPIVAGLVQTSGVTTGGTQVTINGQDFSGAAGKLQVFFGTVAATSVTILSDTQLVAVAPAHAAGTVDVAVQTPYGTSRTSAADQFTFIPPGPAGQFQFSGAVFQTSENNGTATITVTRTGGSVGTVVIQYATSDGNARAGTDYIAAGGTLTFAAGVTTQTFSITLLDDRIIGEGSESLNLALANPTGGGVIGAVGSAILTIAEDSNAGVAGTLIATGADYGGGPEVKAFHALGETPIFDFYAYDPRFFGGVRVAVGDVTGDSVPDIVTGPGPSGGPDIRVFDGVTGRVVREFMAFDYRFAGGVYVAVGDVNGDGYADIIVGADAGGGPEVKVFSGKDSSVLYDFYAYDYRFTGGVRVAAGDVNHDGKTDIITAAGPGGGPHVEVFSGANGQLLRSFMAYDPRFTSGVYVAAADINGDGFADIITGAGAGGGPHVEVFSGATGAVLQSFMAFSPYFSGGVRVGAVSDVNGDGKPDIVVTQGPGAQPGGAIFDGVTLATLDNFFAYDPRFPGGVFVGGR